MYTVRSVEAQIQAYEEQEQLVAALIRQIRAEPAWQSGVNLDAQAKAAKKQAEQNFEVFAQQAEKMQTSVSRFRTHAELLQASEDSKNQQEVLQAMSDQLNGLLPLVTQMKNGLLVSLNGFLEQRGAEPYFPISPKLN
jgi:uncharacterized protein YhaN